MALIEDRRGDELAEIGRRVGLSRGRVRVIVRKAGVTG